MKRRSFLKGLIAAPFAAKAVVAMEPEKPPVAEMETISYPGEPVEWDVYKPNSIMCYAGSDVEKGQLVYKDPNSVITPIVRPMDTRRPNRMFGIVTSTGPGRTCTVTTHGRVGKK